MKFFDLHCDTIGECFLQNKSLKENDMHLDLKRGAYVDEHRQVLAVWMPDEYRGEAAFDYFLRVYDRFKRETAKNADNKSFKPILAVEGGSVLGGDLKRIKALSGYGVKILTLTWNAENEIAGGAYSEAGLSNFGKEAVFSLEEANITVDVSHLNRKSFFDVAKIARKPFVATHSNADIVNKFEGHKRNLSDEQIKIIRDCGGLVGLNFYEEFLDDDKAFGVEALLRQIDYFTTLSCENVLAIGTDFDGCTVCEELCGIEKIGEIKEKLILRGVGKKLADDIFFNNANSFFKTIKIPM